MLDVRAQPNVCAENRDDDWWILMGLMHAQVSVLKLETRALNCASFDALKRCHSSWHVLKHQFSTRAPVLEPTADTLESWQTNTPSHCVWQADTTCWTSVLNAQCAS